MLDNLSDEDELNNVQDGDTSFEVEEILALAIEERKEKKEAEKVKQGCC